VKRVQITIVHADTAAGALKCFLQLCRSMHLDERFEANVLTQCRQVNKLRDIESGGD
jgi:hypothetical protein